MNLLDKTLQDIQPVAADWIRAAERRQLELTKPPGSLGRLEEIANRLAAIRESFSLTASHPRIVLFAGDHGVCAEGVRPPSVYTPTAMQSASIEGAAATFVLNSIELFSCPRSLRVTRTDAVRIVVVVLARSLVGAGAAKAGEYSERVSPERTRGKACYRASA